MLRRADGSQRIVADDVEPDARGDRLELLTIVRGLEALDQPSRVTVVTPSLLVRKGLRYGLTRWRENGWRWERFGEMVPVKNADLWQRIDRALRFHQLECRVFRFDDAHVGSASRLTKTATRVGQPTQSCSSAEEDREAVDGVWERLQRQWDRVRRLGRMGARWVSCSTGG